MVQYRAIAPRGGLRCFRLRFGLTSASVTLVSTRRRNMPAILYDFLDLWRRYFPTVAALLSLGSIIAVASNVAAEEPKHIRITLARSVSAIPLWGIGPFAEKTGFRVEYIPAGTNADMQRNLQSGIELGTLGYQSPGGHG